MRHSYHGSAVLQRVEPHREHDPEAAVELALRVTREVEHVLVPKVELAVHVPDHLTARENVEVVGDRDQTADVRHEVDHTTQNRHRLRALVRDRNLLLVRRLYPP